MKFDYRGIVLRIKNTLENIYRRTNCHGDFFVMTLVFDARIDGMSSSEYIVSDVVKLVSTDKKYDVGVQALLETSNSRLKSGGDLTVKDLCGIFKSYCKGISNPIFSEIYPVYESEAFKTGQAPPLESGCRQEDEHLRGVIAVCAKSDYSRPDDFLVKLLSGFGSSFYELVTREYLRCFASGIVNSVVSQSAMLPANIVSAAGVKYMNCWGKLLLKTGGYGRYDGFADNINKIAELAYESSEACGRIIFCADEFPDQYTLLKFKIPYKIGNHTLVRKLLQIVGHGESLGATGDSIYGIISDRQAAEYRPSGQVMFAVNFERERMWNINYLGSLTENPVKVFESEYEAYKYSEEKLDRNRITKAFAGFYETDLAGIFEIIGSAIDGRNGTMVVFSKEAAEETGRLKNTCIPLKTPIALGNGENSELVKFITSIDGAVLCDETGVCHAIGVILDGFSSADEESAEDISHGARHNSAHRYLRGHKGQCVIVVISEDGDISVIS